MSTSSAERLDYAFLFLLGITAFLFAIMQIILAKNILLLIFLPLMFSGIFFPFYIGYLRGAVEYNSGIERLRGWIYFYYAFGYYFISILLITIPDYYGIPSFGYFVVFALIYGMVPLGKIIKWIQKTLSLPFEKTAKFTIGSTIMAAFFLFAFTFLLVETIRLLPEEQMGIWHLAILLWIFTAFIVSERTAKKYSDRLNKMTIKVDDKILGLSNIQFVSHLWMGYGGQLLQILIKSNRIAFIFLSISAATFILGGIANESNIKLYCFLRLSDILLALSAISALVAMILYYYKTEIKKQFLS